MQFWRFFGRRVFQSIVTLFVVLALLWSLFRLIPGDPTAIFLGTGQLNAADIARLREAWGLDQPLYVQFFEYIKNILRGDFGMSFQYRRPVSDVILPMMYNTLLIMAPAIVIAILTGIAMGSVLGWRRGERIEAIASLVVLIPRSMPIFWVSILFLMFFSYWLNWFPIGGIRTPGFFPETWIETIPGYDVARHMVLPLMVAFVYFVPDPLMIMRTSMLEARGEDYITFAKATGLPDNELRRIARRNAILPVLTYTAIMVSFAFGGQVLLEVVFSWPGMGRTMVQAVSHRDFPVAQAAFFLMAVIVIVLNLVIDVLYAFLDPRITYE